MYSEYTATIFTFNSWMMLNILDIQSTEGKCLFLRWPYILSFCLCHGGLQFFFFNEQECLEHKKPNYLKPRKGHSSMKELLFDAESPGLTPSTRPPMLATTGSGLVGVAHLHPHSHFYCSSSSSSSCSLTCKRKMGTGPCQSEYTTLIGSVLARI